MKKLIISIVTSAYFFSLATISMDHSPAQVYAIIEPARYYASAGDQQIVNNVMAIFYRLAYEKIDDYSLGHDVQFFSSFNEAKKIFPTIINNEPEDSEEKRRNKKWYNDFLLRQCSQAIIELELDNGAIVSLIKIHEIKDYEKAKGKKEIYIPSWKEKSADETYISPGAIAEIDRQYLFYKSSPANNK